MDRAKYYLNGSLLPLGPASIDFIEPEYGSFQPSNGMPIYFSRRYNNAGGEIINHIITWNWPIVTSGSALFETLMDLNYGDAIHFSGQYGSGTAALQCWSGEVIDIASRQTPLILNGGKRAYSFTIKFNTY